MSIPNHWPLVLTSYGDAFRQLSEGFYYFLRDETAKVSCPGSSLMSFETTEETITCVSGTKFERGGMHYDFSSFGCRNVSFKIKISPYNF